MAERVGGARTLARDRQAAKAAQAEADDAVEVNEDQRDTILAFVAGLKRPVGRRLVAQALRGSRAKPLLRRGLGSHPLHGALAALPEAAILRTVDALLAEGRLGKRGRKFPTVWMPDKPVRAAPVRGAAAGTPRPRRDQRTGLAARLADWRRKEAKKRRWKPYQVFPDATLNAIVAEQPRSRDALLALPGMGPVRVERFGDAILALLVGLPAMPP